MGRLDCHATANNLYNLASPAACEVSEVRGVLERVGLEKGIFYQAGRCREGSSSAPAPKGINLYAYDRARRLFGQFLAYNLYRWEIIVRESAIFGILGVVTLGYYLDAAISELRFDVAVVLVLARVGLCDHIDALWRGLRKALDFSMLATRLTDAPSR